MKSDRITIRLHPEQMQLLRELRDKIGASCSLIIRSIILDFLSRNEETLENIIAENSRKDADNQEVTEKA